MTEPTVPPPLDGPATSGLPALEAWNRAQAEQAERLLRSEVCACVAWTTAVTAGRPYRDVAALHAASDAAVRGMTTADLAEAMDGHARIGQPRPGDAHGHLEQSGARDTTDAVRQALAEGNREYERRFGQVFLVCATGRSAEEMLADLRERLGNSMEVERERAREELRKINLLRLDRMVAR